jgi:hypothetical protein
MNDERDNRKHSGSKGEAEGASREGELPNDDVKLLSCRLVVPRNTLRRGSWPTRRWLVDGPERARPTCVPSPRSAYVRSRSAMRCRADAAGDQHLPEDTAGARHQLSAFGGRLLMTSKVSACGVNGSSLGSDWASSASARPRNWAAYGERSGTEPVLLLAFLTSFQRLHWSYSWRLKSSGEGNRKGCRRNPRGLCGDIPRFHTTHGTSVQQYHTSYGKPKGAISRERLPLSLVMTAPRHRNPGVAPGDAPPGEPDRPTETCALPESGRHEIPRHITWSTAGRELVHCGHCS